MKSTFLPTLTLGLAAAIPAAVSSPTNVQTSPQGKGRGARRQVTPPPKGEEFSLAMKVEGTYVSLTATYSSTSDDIVLQAGRLSVYPGTPTYTNESATASSTSGYNTSLVFDLMNSSTSTTTTTNTNIPPGLYGLSVPDLGELYGASASVSAAANYQEFAFDVTDGTVYHQLTSAMQNWFACNDTTVDGGVNYFLKWGVYNEDLTSPSGCLSTTVIQNFNVPGGASS